MVLMVLCDLAPAVQAQSIAYQDEYITVEYARIRGVYWVKITVISDGALILGWEGDLPSLRRRAGVRGIHTLLARKTEFDICNFKAYKYKGRIHILVDYTLMGYTVDVVLPRQ